MKSATSCFNGALIRKNLTRFWPLWALYTLFWVYVLPVNCILSSNRSYGLIYLYNGGGNTYLQRFVRSIPGLLQVPGLFLAVIFGILAAMAMFSYLYNGRSACMMHSLPVRREELFLSAYTAGIIGFMGPHLLVWLLTLAAEAAGGYVQIWPLTLWLLGQSAMCLFFFSFAVFCAVFTGHILALPIFYGIFNFLAYVVVYLIDALLESFLYGYAGISESVGDTIVWMVPSVQLLEHLNWWYNDELEAYVFDGGATLAVYAAAGLVLAGIALLIYLTRHVESAGDVVSVPVMRPVFKYGVAVCSALTLGYFFSVFILGMGGTVSMAGSMLLWGAIGYFAAEMLLRRSFRVLSAWKGCAVLLGVLLAAIVVLRFDLIGYGRHIPDPQTVQSVTVGSLYSYTVPYDNGRYISDIEITDPEGIRQVTALHQAIVDQHDQPGSYGSHASVRVVYHMKDGTTLSRRYYSVGLDEGSELARELETLVNRPDVIRDAYRLEELTSTQLINVCVDNVWDTEQRAYQDLYLHELGEPDPAVLESIRQAVLQDFREGNLGRRYLFDNSQERRNNTYRADLRLIWLDVQPYQAAAYNEYMKGMADGDEYYIDDFYRGYSGFTPAVTVTLTPQAVHTLAALRAAGLLSDTLWPDRP